MRTNYIVTSVAAMILCLAAPVLATDPEQSGAQAADSGQAAGAGKRPAPAASGKGFDEKAFGKAILNLEKPQGNERPVARGELVNCSCDGPYTDSVSGLQEKAKNLQNVAELHKSEIQNMLKSKSINSHDFYIYFSAYELMGRIGDVAVRSEDLLSWIATQKKQSKGQLNERKEYNRIHMRFDGVAKAYYEICEDLHIIKGYISDKDYKALYDICDNAIYVLNENGIEPFCSHVNIK